LCKAHQSGLLRAALFFLALQPATLIQEVQQARH